MLQCLHRCATSHLTAWWIFKTHIPVCVHNWFVTHWKQRFLYCSCHQPIVWRTQGYSSRAVECLCCKCFCLFFASSLLNSSVRVFINLQIGMIHSPSLGREKLLRRWILNLRLKVTCVLHSTMASSYACKKDAAFIGKVMEGVKKNEGEKWLCLSLIGCWLVCVGWDFNSSNTQNNSSRQYGQSVSAKKHLKCWVNTRAVHYTLGIVHCALFSFPRASVFHHLIPTQVQHKETTTDFKQDDTVSGSLWHAFIW